MNQYLVDETLLQEILAFLSTARSDRPIVEIVTMIDKIRKLKPIKDTQQKTE